MDLRRSGRTIAIHPHADLYGSDRMFLESVAALGPDVLAVVSKDGPLVDALRQRAIPCEIKEFPVLRKVDLRTPAKAVLFVLQLLRSLVTLTSWLRAQDAAVVYVSTIAAPEWLIAARSSGARVVCHVHESEPQMSRLASALLLSPLLAAHCVIANSADTLAWIGSSLGTLLTRRTRVIHNGVREPSGSGSSPTTATTARSLVVVGRLAARKGQQTAISALALVRRAGFDVTLTLVGDSYPGYEDYVEALHALAAREQVGDSTVFAGFQDPAPYVAAADVVLVPSLIEPFGLVAAEALLLGRPVVASRVGGLPEIIRDGETGLLVDPDDPRALADAIIRLLSDPALAAELGRAGRADAQARFSMAAYSAHLSDAVLEGSAAQLGR
ncbi:glycosyltransferase family 4 protein [Geodermatophilus sp. URMC 64]